MCFWSLGLSGIGRISGHPATPPRLQLPLPAVPRSERREGARALELAAVRDDDGLRRLAAAAANRLDLLHDVHALGHEAEHDVLAVEPVGLDRAEEEPA